MTNMEITLTCSECGSGIHIKPTKDATEAKCQVCENLMPISFNDEHLEGRLKTCPSCSRMDFYKQKDFNRKIGVGLFVFGAISVLVFEIIGVGFPWNYSVFLGLAALDILLYFFVPMVVACYKCNTLFRNVANIEDIHGFNHEMHDRIVYSDHDFKGEQLDH